MTSQNATRRRWCRARSRLVILAIAVASAIPALGGAVGAGDAAPASPSGLRITGTAAGSLLTATRPDVRPSAGRHSATQAPHGAGFAVAGLRYALARPYGPIWARRSDGSWQIVIDVVVLWRGRAPPAR